MSELRSKVRRVRRLKKGGIAAYDDHPEIKSGLEDLIRDCRAVGLFFVPGGELESWSPHLTDCPNGTSKPERAALAASKIRDAERKQGDVREFMQSVLDFLRVQRDAV